MTQIPIEIFNLSKNSGESNRYEIYKTKNIRNNLEDWVKKIGVKCLNMFIPEFPL